MADNGSGGFRHPGTGLVLFNHQVHYAIPVEPEPEVPVSTSKEVAVIAPPPPPAKESNGIMRIFRMFQTPSSIAGIAVTLGAMMGLLTGKIDSGTAATLITGGLAAVAIPDKRDGE